MTSISQLPILTRSAAMRVLSTQTRKTGPMRSLRLYIASYTAISSNTSQLGPEIPLQRYAEPLSRLYISNIPVRVDVPLIPLEHSYFAGHSLTVVGLEKRKSGTTNLLVLDPMFKPSPGILQLIGTRFRTASPEKLIKAYRRGDTYLEKHTCFELLK